MIVAGSLAASSFQPARAEEAPKGTVNKLPASGRSYEALLPPGKMGDLVDMPVVVYLHGSGDPRLDRAKREYWPILARRKCMLVLARGKSKKMWLAGEEKYVADVLADVRTRYAVDAGRIVLLGVSGGGQLALFLADRLPEKFRAVIVVSTSPVVIRGRRHGWFYPSRKVLKSCPYLVVNHITQGSALMYWRQVRAKLAPGGASISILPVTGKADEYLPPPKELPGWLEQVLAGKHPKPLPDPQKAAVAKMFEKCVAALPKAVAAAKPGPPGEKIAKDGEKFRLAVTPPANFERSRREDENDSTGAPLTQIRIEHTKWPIHVRCEARATGKPMDEVLSAEEAQTARRGVLYQVYHAGPVAAGGRIWKLKIGSTTYPDRRRGWVSTLFLHAAAPIGSNPKRWLTVLVLDETQQPKATELAATLKTTLSTLAAQPAAKN